jgi:hypothetical protein
MVCNIKDEHICLNNVENRGVSETEREREREREVERRIFGAFMNVVKNI